MTSTLPLWLPWLTAKSLFIGPPSPLFISTLFREPSWVRLVFSLAAPSQVQMLSPVPVMHTDLSPAPPQPPFYSSCLEPFLLGPYTQPMLHCNISQRLPELEMNAPSILPLCHILPRRKALLPLCPFLSVPGTMLCATYSASPPSDDFPAWNRKFLHSSLWDRHHKQL